jgi:signal transduction histidine kinase
MKWPVWREVLGPTLLVGLLWLAVSTSTTVFMSWKDAAYQELLSNNLTVVESIQSLQSALTAVVLSRGREQPRVGSSQEFSQLAAGYAAARAALSPVADAETTRLVGELHAQYGFLLEASETAEPGSSQAQSASRLTPEEAERLLLGLDDDCRQVIQHNREVSVASQEEFRYYNRLVMSIRQILNLLGPAVGVWLGYRAASRLRSQIARITVKLGETDLGRVEVAQEAEDTDPADLESLDQQVGRVQLRLMEVVTELQSAQQEVLRSERLAAVGQLAAGVAHELRNPLTSVKLLVQTAQEAAKGKGGGPATVFDPQTFEVLTSEIDRMERTIQSLLDFARPTQPRRTRHDLREPLRRVLNLISARASQQRVAIDCRGGEAPLWVVGDTEQLVQVFLNLTLNGIDAMPEGGRLGLELTRGLAEGSRWVGLRVNDQGPGLSAEVLGRLFEPFVTTKERGTGLGLAVSRRIVLEHSGELLVRNLPAGGAEFELRLPEAEVVQAAVEKPELALVN